MQINEFKELVNKSEKIYISSHMNPDGDNLGSLTGLYSMLKLLDKEVSMIEDDLVPEHLKFLPNLEKYEKSEDLLEIPDLFITVDCADIDRLSENAKSIFLKTKETINIDHHATNTNFAKLNIVDSNSPATGELLYDIFEKSNYKIDINVATSLYTAISSDTGSFKYDSVRENTFLIASKLLKFGINTSEININLYQKKSISKTKLLISAMNNMKISADGKVATAYINDKMLEELGADKSDSDGIVEFLRDIENVEVAMFFKIGKENIRLSTRTKSYVDATNLVKPYLGGGHIRAAGATLDLPFEERYNELINIAEEEINERNFGI